MADVSGDMAGTGLDERYHRLVLVDFGPEFRFGFMIAYFRTLAAPRVAALLARTGYGYRRPLKRAHDTGLLMYEMMYHGLDSETGKAVVARLVSIHSRFPGIRQGDYAYVLAAFVVPPVRWAAVAGPRPLTVPEQDTVAAWYAELGRRLGVERPPQRFAEFAALFDDYEARELRHTPAAERLFRTTVASMTGQFRVLSTQTVMLLARLGLDEPAATALGVRPLPSPLRRLLLAALRARARANRRFRGQPTTSWFVPGKATQAYPNGYEMADLGPDV